MATDATHTDVKDAAGATKTLNDRQIGRVAQAQGAATTLSNEDKAALDLLHTDLVAVQGFVDGLEGFVDGLETLITAGNTILTDLRTAAQDIVTESPVSAHTPSKVIDFVPVLDTAIYAAGDVLAATASIPAVVRANGLQAILLSLTGIDKSKQKPAMTILFYDAAVTSAAANAANNLSDADQLRCLGFVRIAAADWIDYANNSLLCYSGAKGPNLELQAPAGATNIWAVCILDAGTPTFAVGDLMFKLGLVQA